MSNKILSLYEGIARVKDKSTRNILYIQLIMEYFPEAYKVISPGVIIDSKYFNIKNKLLKELKEKKE